MLITKLLVLVAATVSSLPALITACGNPVDVKAALVNNGRSIELTWRPPNTSSVEYYSIDINRQRNTTTDTKYLIQNPEKQFYTFNVQSYCGTSGYGQKWVRATIGFVGLAVYATVGQSIVSIGWRTTATINNSVDVKNKDINTNIFLLLRSNVPTLYENQYKGRINYTGNLANGVISFTLSSVTRNDAGYYMSKVGTTDMGGQVLVVLDKPRKPTINSIFSYVGKPLELNCNSLKTSKPDYYTPELNYTWWIDGSVHVYNTRHQGRYRQNQDKLVIDNVTKEDKGRTFSCEASDRGQKSEQSNTITLDPRFGPETVILTQGRRNNTVKVGDKFGPINCTAECNPSCTYTWKFRKTGDDGPRREIRSSNILIISQVTRQLDGEYRCIAKSTDPHVLTPNGTKTITLNVQFRPEIKNVTSSVNNSAVRIINTGTPVTVSENDNVNLQCNTEANPKAMISWNRAGKTLNNITSGESLVYNLGTSISCETSGIYSCMADNRIPPAANRTVNLLVQCKPKQNRDKPLSNKYGSRLNSTVNVSLSVIAYPRPTHRWETNATALVNERPISFINSYSFKFEGSVTIRRTSDFGTHCLQLTNNKGTSKLCLEIQAEDVPLPPTNFTADTIYPEMINFTWISEFNGGRNQTFYLEYREKGANSEFTKRTIPDSGRGKEMRFSVENLKANVEYTFRLYSGNDLGNNTVQSIEVRTKAYPTKEPVTSNLTATLAGVIAAVFVALIVVIVLIVLIRRRGSTNNKEKSASGQHSDVVYSQVNKPNNIQDNLPVGANADVVYSEVNKAKKNNKPQNGASNDVMYSEVTKPKNKKSKQGPNVDVMYSEVKKSDQNDNAYADDGNIYENSALLDNNEASDSKATDNANPVDNTGDGRHKNEEGLIYVDVDLGGKKEEKDKGKPVVHGEEDRTEYMSIDFTKKAEPQD